MGNFWFAFDWKKYEDDTSDLFLVQHGAYLQLLMHYYKSGLPLPQDTERLTRISRAHTEEEIRAVSDVLQRYFVLKSDGWHNKRADEELSKMRRISKVRSNAARSKSSANASTNAEAKPDQLPTQLTTNNKQKAESKTKAASAFVTPDWVPKEEWAEFEKMRRTIRKPMTDKARSLIVGELFKLRSRGHDPKLVLEQSISNSWQGVFELKGESHGTNRGNHQAPRQHVTAQHQRLAGNVLAVGAKYGLRPTSALAAAAGSAGVGNSDHSDGSGQTPRLAGDNPRIVEGEVKPVS